MSAAAGGDHLMKSLDDLIADQKKHKGGGLPKHGRQQYAPQFIKKGIQKNKAYLRGGEAEEGKDWPQRQQQRGPQRGGYVGQGRFERKPFVKPFQANTGFKGLAQGGTTVLVSGLHYDITEDDLKELFSAHGNVHSCRILWDKHDRSTGEARATFENPKGAEAAVKALDGTEVEGQTIKVVIE